VQKKRPTPGGARSRSPLSAAATSCAGLILTNPRPGSIIFRPPQTPPQRELPGDPGTGRRAMESVRGEPCGPRQGVRCSTPRGGASTRPGSPGRSWAPGFMDQRLGLDSRPERAVFASAIIRIKQGRCGRVTAPLPSKTSSGWQCRGQEPHYLPGYAAAPPCRVMENKGKLLIHSRSFVYLKGRFDEPKEAT
jgi:hypothetical protein